MQFPCLFCTVWIYVFDPIYPRGCRAPVPHAPSSATIALQFPGEQALTHISQFKIRTSILGALHNRNIFPIKCSKTVWKIHSYSNDIAIYFCLRTTAFEHRLDNSGWIVIEIISPNTFLFPSTVQMFVYLWRRTS